MATVRPFRGIRPTAGYAEAVAALPYDVMNSSEAKEMVRGKPYSFLHVDKPEIDLPEGTDPHDSRVYEKAKENLGHLLASGILVQDSEPALYIYRLIMDGRAQTGVVCCASVDEYLNGTIKKHELTRADKEQDRINHVNACNANTGPIFLTYNEGANPCIGTLVGEWAATHAPVYDFCAEDGITHQVWVVNDAETIDGISKGFGSVPALYIADGHHRNASAAKVAQMRRDADPAYDKEAGFNYYLAVVFPSQEMYIMDYNRVVKDLNGLDDDALLSAVGMHFDVTPQPSRYKPSHPHTFGMDLNKCWYALALRAEPAGEGPVAALDVSILQKLVLEPVLGIKDPRTDKRIDFVGGMRGLEELERRVDSGEMQVAFALYPTSIQELMGIADAGLIMPPKSTWFEPKLRSGLFIHDLGGRRP